jgi:hypothetical protein
MNKLGFDTPEKIEEFTERKSKIIDDLRVIDMYDAAIRRDLKVYHDRTGNWVQQFESDGDAKLFTTAQFFRYAEVERTLRELFSDPKAVLRQIDPPKKP